MKIETVWIDYSKIRISTDKKLSKTSGYIKDKGYNNYIVEPEFFKKPSIKLIETIYMDNVSDWVYNEFAKYAFKKPVNNIHVTNSEIHDFGTYFPNALERFSIYNNHHPNGTRLPNYVFANSFDVSYSNLYGHLPGMDQCKRIVLNKCGVISINNLPNCEYLDCSDNLITELSNLPKIRILKCSNNKLKSLPSLDTVIGLNCSNNDLNRLPNLPMCETLDCSNNPLTFLPNLPSVIELDCSQTSIDRFGRINNVVKEIKLKDMKVKVNCDDVRRNHPQAEVICKSENQPSYFKSVPSTLTSVRFGDIPDPTSAEFSQMCSMVQQSNDKNLMKKMLDYFNQTSRPTSSQKLVIEDSPKLSPTPVKKIRKLVFEEEPGILEKSPAPRSIKDVKRLMMEEEAKKGSKTQGMKKLIIDEESEDEESAIKLASVKKEGRPSLTFYFTKRPKSLEKKRTKEEIYVQKLVDAGTDEDVMAEILTEMVPMQDLDVYKVLVDYRIRVDDNRAKVDTLEDAWRMIEDDLDLDISEKDELLARITHDLEKLLD